MIGKYELMLLTAQADDWKCYNLNFGERNGELAIFLLIAMLETS